MAKRTVLNPFTRKLDYITDNVFDVNGLILTDSNGVQWRLTIDTSGTLVTTKLIITNAGLMIGAGPMFGLTYVS